MVSRRALQLVTLLLALMTIAAGGLSLVLGVGHPLYRGDGLAALSSLDSNLRFFGGLAIGLGAVLLWLVPRIEQHAELFRAVWLCAFLGGLGRLISVIFVGMPSVPLFAFAIVEVVGAPFLVYWQYTVAGASVRHE